MARTRSTRGGAAGGRGGGRRGGRTSAIPREPVVRNQRSQPEVEREDSPPLEDDNLSNHEEEQLVLEPAVRHAIADEVYQVMHRSMPGLIAEALREHDRNISNPIRAREPVRRPRVIRDRGEPEEVYSSDFEEDERVPRREVTRGCSYSTFQRCKPPTFDGTKDAVATHQWVREMQAVIKISECREDQVPTFVAHSFVSEALCWWDNLLEVMGPSYVRRLRWEEMKRLVIEQFCPSYELEKLEEEFAVLKAGNMTHREYTSKFNEMARLFPDMVTPEDKRIKRYIRGLPVDIRRGVVTTRMSTFRSVVSISGRLYEERDDKQLAEPKKNQGNSTGGDNKRPRDDSHKPFVKKVKVESQDDKKGSR